MCAASAALCLSGVPFMGPIGAARVGYKDGEYILNPTKTEVAEGELDLVVAGTLDAVMMVESEAKELSEDVMLGAVMFAHAASKKVCEGIIKLAEKAAKDPWELDTARGQGRDQGQAQERHRQGPRGRLQADQQAGAPDRDQRGPRKGARSVRRSRSVGSGRLSRHAEAGEEARGRRRPQRDPQGRPPHRRPRHQDRPPDRGDGRLPAAHPRLGACSPAARRRRSAPRRWAPRTASR